MPERGPVCCRSHEQKRRSVFGGDVTIVTPLPGPLSVIVAGARLPDQSAPCITGAYGLDCFAACSGKNIKEFPTPYPICTIGGSRGMLAIINAATMTRAALAELPYSFI